MKVDISSFNVKKCKQDSELSLKIQSLIKHQHDLLKVYSVDIGLTNTFEQIVKKHLSSWVQTRRNTSKLKFYMHVILTSVVNENQRM